jgi:hypothetical protein
MFQDAGSPDTPDSVVLNGEVFYERRVSSASDITPIEVPATAIDASFATSFSEPNSQTEPLPELYVRSEYAPAYGLEIEKRYTDISS